MRVKTEIWVMAYIRRCFGEGIPALVVRRGNAEAGAVYIKVNLLEGHVGLYGPAPAGFDADDGNRRWIVLLGESAVPESDADAYLERQSEFDPDFWVVEVEDRQGRHFLGTNLITV
ncbi:MAG: DUF1491 family protein [Hyphomicrobiales bacterium]|nr:DUF1491 family protein [Hyphomicrobiales bacterium]